MSDLKSAVANYRTKSKVINISYNITFGIRILSLESHRCKVQIFKLLL